ncbi:streptophobe family protein [Streptomyces sp. NPDC049813]|uniref:streptophobe family protein n=1 Tax=Streptomyces sp. NPDC049813 TaxID=3365597 RepID=UPI00378DFE5D
METGHDTNRHGRMPVGDVLLSAIAAVSWAFLGMAGVAALGLHLLEADTAGSLGPMTAAVVAVGAGGRVTPSGDMSSFGIDAAQAHTAIDVTPLGVSLVGALVLSWFFLRSLRARGVEVSPGELAARVAAVVVLFVALLGGLAWVGHDLITIDGAKLGLNDVPGAGGLPGDLEDQLPGGVGELLPDRLGDLADAKASVGFTVRTGATLLGGAAFAAGVLLIALLASRRTPLPRALAPVHRLVRPAASALATVLLVTVLAGLAAAAYAMTGDDHPKRIAGAALLGAPNGAWLGVPLGLFVPWDGRAAGEFVRLLPDPLDDLLGVSSDRSVTLGRLAELDGRVWLLAVAMALMTVFAGVLTAVRTPRARGQGAAGFAARCAVRLGVLTALALPLLVWLTDVSADASLSVLGFDAFDAGIELHGQQGTALLLGAAWGAGAGAAGALLACASGAAGRRAAPPAVAAERARGETPAASAPGAQAPAGQAPSGQAPAAQAPSGQAPPSEAPGPYRPSRPYRPSNADTNPYLRPYGVEGRGVRSGPGSGSGPGASPPRVTWPSPPGADDPAEQDRPPHEQETRRQAAPPRRAPDPGRAGEPTVAGPRRPGGNGGWPAPPAPPPPPPPPAGPGGGGRRRREDRDER